MATEAIIQSISVPTASSTDLSASQYCAVTIDTNGQAVLATAGKNCDGIVQNAPKGTVADVAIFGISKVHAGGSFAIGDLVEITTGGKFIKNSVGTVVAKALEAGADGSIVKVLMLKSNAVYA